MVTTTTTKDNKNNDAYDAVVVGAGMMGLCIARDLADSGGHKVLVVERDANLGGVWFHNNYPELRLQGLGQAWRCFSLPPKYHTSGEHDSKSLYRPTAGEILEYAESLAKHPNIAVSLSTSYEGVEATHMKMHRVQLRSSSGTEHTVATKAVILAVGYDTHRTGKPWFPVDPKAVKNGAKLLHSAEIGGQPLGTCKGRTYVVGSHKAAMEVLRGIDNPDGVIWANRGHYTFIRGDFVDDAALAGALPPWIIANTLIPFPTILAFKGMFQTAESIMMKSGMGIRVYDGDELNKKLPTFHGGVVRDADVEHARRFEQLKFTELEVDAQKGALVLHRSDGDVVVVGCDDRVIFCTGQRTGVTTDDFLDQALQHSADGLFVALPVSIQACTSAAYCTKLAMDFLDGHPSRYYSAGGFRRGIEMVKAQVRTFSSGSIGHSVWAKPMVMGSGAQIKLAGSILPSVRGDLCMSPDWISVEWYGKVLDARKVLNDLAKPDYGGLQTLLVMLTTVGGVVFALNYKVILASWH
jgi:hypothetical protein